MWSRTQVASDSPCWILCPQDEKWIKTLHYAFTGSVARCLNARTFVSYVFRLGAREPLGFNLSLRRSVQRRGTLGGLAGALEDPVWKSDTSHFDRCLHVANRCWRGGGVSRSRGTYRTRTTVASRRSSSSIANSASTRSSLCVTSTPTSTRYSRPSPGWWSCPFRFRIRTPYTTTRSFNLISSTTTILTALVSWNYGSRVILSLFYL